MYRNAIFPQFYIAIFLLPRCHFLLKSTCIMLSEDAVNVSKQGCLNFFVQKYTFVLLFALDFCLEASFMNRVNREIDDGCKRELSSFRVQNSYLIGLECFQQIRVLTFPFL